MFETLFYIFWFCVTLFRVHISLSLSLCVSLSFTMKTLVCLSLLALSLSLSLSLVESVENVILEPTLTEHQTRPTYIDPEVLEMLPDHLAAKMVVKNTDEWTVKDSPHALLSDSTATPQASKLRFRELRRRVEVKQKEKM